MPDKTQGEQLLAAYKEFRRNVITPLSSQKTTRSLLELLKNNPDAEISMGYADGEIWVVISVDGENTSNTIGEEFDYDNLDHSDECSLVLKLEELIKYARECLEGLDDEQQPPE